LRYVSLWRTKVTAAGVHEFQERLPMVRVNK
jgi:hypothetical protein